MKTLSLFSGIGAHDLGLQRAGMEIVGQIEIDDYCQSILKKHWPHVPKWKDITNVSGVEVTAKCGTVELITGGFPCQDISVAGRQKGIEGKKSGLWREMHRLVIALRPNWVLIENVPALRTKGADTALSSLEEADYTCWSFVVGAWAIGAPHRRNRVWIVAHSNSHDLRQQSRRRGGKDRQDKIEPAQSSQTVAVSESAGFQTCKCSRSKKTLSGLTHFCDIAKPGPGQNDWEHSRLFESQMGRTANGTSRGLALKALGNANPPQILEVIGRAIQAI